MLQIQSKFDVFNLSERANWRCNICSCKNPSITHIFNSTWTLAFVHLSLSIFSREEYKRHTSWECLCSVQSSYDAVLVGGSDLLCHGFDPPVLGLGCRGMGRSRHLYLAGISSKTVRAAVKTGQQVLQKEKRWQLLGTLPRAVLLKVNMGHLCIHALTVYLHICEVS